MNGQVLMENAHNATESYNAIVPTVAGDLFTDIKVWITVINLLSGIGNERNQFSSG